MQINKSGYYAWVERPRSARDIRNAELAVKIIKIFDESGGIYGTRRIAKDLIAIGIDCGRYLARTFMKIAGAKVKTKRKFK